MELGILMYGGRGRNVVLDVGALEIGFEAEYAHANLIIETDLAAHKATRRLQRTEVPRSWPRARCKHCTVERFSNVYRLLLGPCGATIHADIKSRPTKGRRHRRGLCIDGAEAGLDRSAANAGNAARDINIVLPRKSVFMVGLLLRTIVR